MYGKDNMSAILIRPNSKKKKKWWTSIQSIKKRLNYPFNLIYYTLSSHINHSSSNFAQTEDFLLATFNKSIRTNRINEEKHLVFLSTESSLTFEVENSMLMIFYFASGKSTKNHYYLFNLTTIDFFSITSIVW